MSSPALFAARIQSGAASPVTIDNTFDFRGFTAGQPLFFGFYYRADRVTGADLDTLTPTIRWWDNADVELTATTASVSLDASTSGFVFSESAHLAPANAVRGRVNFTGTAGGTTFEHTIYITAIRVAKTEAFAQVTRWVDGPPQSTAFNYDYLGAQDGWSSRDLTFNLLTPSGAVTSGITWSWTVLTGNVNSLTSASGSQSLTGDGTADLSITALGSSATILLSALYNGLTYTKQVDLTRVDGPAPTGGGGGGGGSVIVSQTSGFQGCSNTTFVDQSPSGTGMSGTMPGGSTTATIAVNLHAMPASGTSGAWTVECKLMRDIGGTPTQIGTTQSADSDWFASDVSGDWAAFNFGFGDTGLTGGATYVWRVEMRITSGARSHFVTGTVQVVA